MDITQKLPKPRRNKIGRGCVKSNKLQHAVLVYTIRFFSKSLFFFLPPLISPQNLLLEKKKKNTLNFPSISWIYNILFSFQKKRRVSSSFLFFFFLNKKKWWWNLFFFFKFSRVWQHFGFFLKPFKLNTPKKKNRNILMADGLDEYAESGFVYNVR